MREEFGEVALFIAVLIVAIAEVFIARKANVLAIHAEVLTFNLHPAFITEEVAVIVVTFAYRAVAIITNVVGYILVRAVDDHVASVAIIVLILVYVITNELSRTVVAVSVVIIVVAIGGKPYSAPIACMVIIVVLMPDVIEVLFTRSFLTASVAERISVIVDMMNAF